MPAPDDRAPGESGEISASPGRRASRKARVLALLAMGGILGLVLGPGPSPGIPLTGPVEVADVSGTAIIHPDGTALFLFGDRTAAGRLPAAVWRPLRAMLTSGALADEAHRSGRTDCMDTSSYGVRGPGLSVTRLDCPPGSRSPHLTDAPVLSRVLALVENAGHGRLDPLPAPESGGPPPRALTVIRHQGRDGFAAPVDDDGSRIGVIRVTADGDCITVDSAGQVIDSRRLEATERDAVRLILAPVPGPGTGAGTRPIVVTCSSWPAQVAGVVGIGAHDTCALAGPAPDNPYGNGTTPTEQRLSAFVTDVLVPAP